jgi:hypothetical protein
MTLIQITPVLAVDGAAEFRLHAEADKSMLLCLLLGQFGYTANFRAVS